MPQPQPQESPLESPRELDGQVFTVTMNFRMVDQNAFDDAVSDLDAADVWGEDDGPDNNTIEELIDIMVGHIDVLAHHREQPNVGWLDMGLERISV
jgi:hypothetical protein